MVAIQKKCPAEAGQYFQAECYVIWFSVFRLDWIFGFLGLDVFAGFVR